MGDQPAPPLQPLAPGNFDRAWNDPPLFSYSSSQGQPGAGSRLTKRVGFPAASTAPPLPTGQDPTAPPSLHDAGAKPPPCLLPPPPSILPPATSLAPPLAPPPEASLSTEELSCLLGELTQQHFSLDKAAELQKRFATLLLAHGSGALGHRIPPLLAKLVTALSESNITVAESCFTTLSADHGGESGNAQWMVALRHLVTKVQEQHKEGQEKAITAPLLGGTGAGDTEGGAGDTGVGAGDTVGGAGDIGVEA